MEAQSDGEIFPDLPVRHTLVWLTRETERAAGRQRFVTERRDDEAALQIALRNLFGAEDFPLDAANQAVSWRRDGLGKPFVTWQGAVQAWAAARHYDARNLHVSNTHDGTAHLVLAAYAENLAGVGVDVVHLPRLQRADRDRDYLLRFAGQFMSEAERTEFLANAAQENEDAVRMRVAAHFSLMEAASKACGTGLKIGGGMGRATSLPKQSLGVRRLTPAVELLFAGEALDRLVALNVVRHAAAWTVRGEYLVSVVLLWKTNGMLLNRVFDSPEGGVFVIRPDGTVILLEFNAFLQRVAGGEVQENDVVAAKVYTDGQRRRAGELRLFARVKSGAIRTDDLPLHTPQGVLAEGAQAQSLLNALETHSNPDFETLLRAAAPTAALSAEMLRAVLPAVSPVSDVELLRPVVPPLPPDVPKKP